MNKSLIDRIIKYPQLVHLIEILVEWLEKDRVGNIGTNVFKGGISSVKLEETIKLPKSD